MKRLVISIPILLLVFFSLNRGFAGARGTDSQAAAAKAAKSQQGSQPKDTTGEGITDVNAAAEPNAAAQAQSIIADDPLLQEDLDFAISEGTTETSLWTRGAVDRRRLKLTRAVHEQVETELDLIRSEAVKEGAVKTAAAIDYLWAARQQRYAEIMEEIENNLKRAALEKTRERGSRKRSGDREGRRERGRDRESRY